MNWEEYKKEAIKYRMEYLNTEEYVAILLIGIVEELAEYRGSVYDNQAEAEQILEYGDLLWNIAELENVMDERVPRHKLLSEQRGSTTYQISLSCVQTVRKHFMKKRNREVLLRNAGDILANCLLHFAFSGIAKEAMVANCEKMKQRHGR